MNNQQGDVVTVVVDRGTLFGDRTCEVTYKMGNNGKMEIVSMRYIEEKPELGKRRT